MNRFLVVEDDKNIQNLYQLLLERYIPGASITCSDNGQDALDLLLSYRFDIVLSDIDMPVMDGIEFHRALKAEANPLAGRLAYCSATANVDHLTYVKNEGLPYLPKPFRVKDFYEFIDLLIASFAMPGTVKCGRKHKRLGVRETGIVHAADSRQDHGLRVFAETRDYSPGGIGVLYRENPLPCDAVVHVEVGKINIAKMKARVIWTNKGENSFFRSGLMWV